MTDVENFAYVDFSKTKKNKDNSYTFELLTFPFYDISVSRNSPVEDIIVKHTIGIRFFLTNLIAKFLKKGEGLYFSIVYSPGDIFVNKKDATYYRNYRNFYFDTGCCLGDLKKIKINDYIELSFNKKFSLGIKTHSAYDICFLYPNIGGEFTTYIHFLKEINNTNIPIDIGIFLKYWYNFYMLIFEWDKLDQKFAVQEFLYPKINSPYILHESFSFSFWKILHLFNSHAAYEGVSYYLGLSIKFYV